MIVCDIKSCKNEIKTPLTAGYCMGDKSYMLCVQCKADVEKFVKDNLSEGSPILRAQPTTGYEWALQGIGTSGFALPPGPMGPAGIPGVDGAMGPKGNKGDKGDTPWGWVSVGTGDVKWSLTDLKWDNNGVVKFNTLSPPTHSYYNLDDLKGVVASHFPQMYTDKVNNDAAQYNYTISDIDKKMLLDGLNKMDSKHLKAVK